MFELAAFGFLGRAAYGFKWFFRLTTPAKLVETSRINPLHYPFRRRNRIRNDRLEFWRAPQIVQLSESASGQNAGGDSARRACSLRPSGQSTILRLLFAYLMWHNWGGRRRLEASY